MGIQVADDGFIFSVGVEPEHLDTDFTFVDWFDGGGADALFENKGLIAISDKLCDIDTIGKSDENHISSLRTCLDTCELISLYVQPSQKSLNFFVIQETSLSFVVFQSDFQRISFVSLGNVQRGNR